MSVKLAFSWQKPGSALLYFRRRVPDDIKPLLAAVGSPHAGKAFIVESLRTSDPKVAAPRIAQLVRQTDEEWKELRNPTRAGVLQQAHRLLEQFGVDPSEPRADERALDAFFEAVEEQLPESVKDDQTIEHGRELDKHLSPVYQAAFQVAQNRRDFTLTDCLDQYAAARPKAAKTARIAFGYLLEYLGKDKDIGKVRRPDVNGFVKHLLAGRHNEDGTAITTSTVVRYVNNLKAAFGRAIRENELAIENVFARVEIPNKGKDVTKRESFTVEQYRHLYRAIDQHRTESGPDQLRCILTLVAETGARLAEIVGLAAGDVHLRAAVPYLEVKEHPWRTVKTLGSARKVPLTPKALEAAQTALGLANDSPFLFPHYTNADRCKADTASAALVQWVRSREGLKGTKLGNHSLRHGMEDLLRAVGCPDSARDQITGHKTPGMGANYGRGYPLEHLAEWLRKASEVARCPSEDFASATAKSTRY